MFISVVVPTYKRPELLQRCLDALVHQTAGPSTYEVIVSDDALALTENHGPAAARNQGWRQARGEVVAFTDDDCIPDPRWVEAIQTFFNGPVDAGWGRLVMPLPADPTDYQLNASLLANAGFVTANCFCRRVVLEALNGFDERFRVAWREDSDFYFRCLDQGFRVGYSADAAVAHPIRPARWGISLWQAPKRQYDALLFKKHPRRFRETVGHAPGSYYAIAFFLIGFAVAVAFHASVIALICAGGWILLSARFCFLRLRHTTKRFAHIAEMIATSTLLPPWAIFWRLKGAIRFGVCFY